VLLGAVAVVQLGLALRRALGEEGPPTTGEAGGFPRS
jgi:hypothetical protein